MGCHYFGENSFFPSASLGIMVPNWTWSAEICFQAHHQRYCCSWQAEKLECIQTKKHAVDAALVFQPTISIPPVMQMIKKSHGNLMCQLALLRASEGSFPEEDFKPLATMTALASSTDTIRMNLARVLVTKVLNEGKRPRCFSSCSLSCNRHSCRHLVYADA